MRVSWHNWGDSWAKLASNDVLGKIDQHLPLAYHIRNDPGLLGELFTQFRAGDTDRCFLNPTCGMRPYSKSPVKNGGFLLSRQPLESPPFL